MSVGNYILLAEGSRDDEGTAVRTMTGQKPSGDIVVVRDGVEALDFLFRSGQYKDREPLMPRLVVLDIDLPRLAGLDVLRRLRADARTITLPVVMLASASTMQEVTDSYASRANSIVRKPLGSSEFSETLRQIADYWLLLNETAIAISDSLGTNGFPSVAD